MKNLALHILDITRNSIRAQASEIKIIIKENTKLHTQTIEIEDNGIGISYEDLCKITDPFYTSRLTRKVGLGIPLLKQNCEQTGGNFTVSSKKGKGTSIKSSFKTNNIDHLPNGDISGVIVMLFVEQLPKKLIFRYLIDNQKYEFKSSSILETLGEEIDYHNFNLQKDIKEMINYNLKNIGVKI